MGNRKTSKNKNTQKTGKPFPAGVALLLILLLSCTAVAACISLGFVIDAPFKVNPGRTLAHFTDDDRVMLRKAGRSIGRLTARHPVYQLYY